MKISTKRITRTSAGFGLILICAQAVADDTELLLVQPNTSSLPNANVMFILDTSGSMGDLVSTVDPYVSTQDYTTGGCDKDNMYWTDVETIPACGGSNTQWIPKTAFHCQAAEKMIAGIGSYTNTMVQFRGDATNAALRWQYLGPGNNVANVECQADAGVHGEYGGPPSSLWADSASDPTGGAWTNKPEEAVSWGAAPRNLAYTVYDGNYLNWKNTPVTVDMRKIDIMKLVTTKVLSSVSKMNVGIMRFNELDGGPVLQAIKDIEANRAATLATVASLVHGGNTPLAETLFESALYWLGRPAHFGSLITEHTTDPAALSSLPGDLLAVYKQPTLDVCAKNFNVLLTDGLPTNDTVAQIEAPKLPNFSDVLAGRTACTGTGQGDCLDDIAEYLAKADINSTLDERQYVTTHTIGFDIDLPILADTATAAGGRYFLANDVESLTIALLRIVGEINELTQSFSAPAVSVNTFNRTQNLNDMYLTVFGARGKAHWPGNLKKYGILNGTIVDADDVLAVDPLTGFFDTDARSIWTPTGTLDGNKVEIGGAANLIPDPTSRKLYTYHGTDLNLDGGSNAISVGNTLAFTNADFGLTGATGEPSQDDLIRWMRGEDIGDKIAGSAVRNAMGDPLHSQPAAIVYGGTPTSPDVVVYTATNDGYLHAINGTTGVELWSFVPKELLGRMTRLFFDSSAKYKQYGLDGNVVPVIKDVDGDGIVESADGDRVLILFGMRRGGTTYFALDVTDKNAPDFLWQRTLPEAGESWSTPVIARMDIDDTSFTFNTDKAVVVIAGGYDTVHDTAIHPASTDAAGAGIHILNLATGETIWHGGPNASVTANTKVFSKMTRSMPNRVRVVDINADGFADRMYTSDMGGQIWRFDVKKGALPASLIDGGVIARLGAEGLATPAAADTRRFFNAPDLSIFRDPIQGRRYISIGIGSGYRAHPFDVSAADRFYSVRDPDVFNQLNQTAYDGYDIITEADLVEISGNTKVVVPATKDGWKFTLPTDQKILADSITFDNDIFFVSFTPNTIAANNCSAGRGTNFLYRVSVVNGDPNVNNLDAIVAGTEDAARRTTLAQGGIAPSPTILFPSPADPTCVGTYCVPPPIMCVGVECDPPGFDPFPVRTLWTQDGIQ